MSFFRNPNLLTLFLINIKKLISTAITAILVLGACAQDKPKDFSTVDPSKKIQLAKVSCGECQFKMKGKGCHLAVRLDGKNYWVDGADIDYFGDAHDKKMGFCNKVRKADVQGEVRNNRFQLTCLKFAGGKTEKDH
jgi:hypothetical protein